MKTLPKAFLIASIACFVLGLTGPGGDLVWGLLYPITAVLFILFFVTNLLAKEMAKLDEETNLLAKEVAKFDEECMGELAFVPSFDNRPVSKSPSRSAERTNKSTSFAEALAR